MHWEFGIERTRERLRPYDVQSGAHRGPGGPAGRTASAYPPTAPASANRRPLPPTTRAAEAAPRYPVLPVAAPRSARRAPVLAAVADTDSPASSALWCASKSSGSSESPAHDGVAPTGTAAAGPRARTLLPAAPRLLCHNPRQ